MTKLPHQCLVKTKRLIVIPSTDDNGNDNDIIYFYNDNDSKIHLDP